MVSTARIALLGFSRMERATFEAFFRIAGKRCPAYAQEADPRAADFVIMDASDAQSRDTVREAGLMARTVALGEPPCEGVLMQLSRPLNLMLIVRALDEVIVRAPDDADHAVDGTGVVTMDVDVHAVPAKPSRAQEHGRSAIPRELAPTMPAGMDTTMLDAGEHLGGGTPQPKRKGASLDHILVVDDSDIALRFMASHLQRFGFQIHLAQSGEEALKRVAERHFEFVFMDVMMEGLDGFQACKTIKRARYEGGKKPPTVVMLTSRGGAVDKLRGTMAGADAYLTKPLREVELLKIVGDREVERYAYAETAAAMTTI